MESTEIFIDLQLKSPECTMISPGYRRPKDERGMFLTGSKKIDWHPDNLIKLETTISQCMKNRYERELVETLERHIPISYVDCSQKGEDDIMFFILKEYLKQSGAKNKIHILGEAIGTHSIVPTSTEDWEKYLEEGAPHGLDDIFFKYSELLQGVLANSDKHSDLFNFESDVVLNGLAQLMEQENKKYLYLYLDKINILSKEEQQRINNFLYTRGRIPEERRIRVKINNGHGDWKTRSSSTGHRVDATHDYSGVNIHEDDL